MENKIKTDGNTSRIENVENKTIREMENDFSQPGTPEHRMAILHSIDVKKGEIASAFVRALRREQFTVREAISILKDAENFIMQSQFV